MPREVIVQPQPSVKHPAVSGGPDNPPSDGGIESHHGLSVGWNKMGWMQVYVIPHDAETSGDWHIVEMDRHAANLLIRTLRKARDAAFEPDA